ncbi:MAG: SpoIVB peptidase [Clostridia bacterium]|nr:SpoIVB peptidase [Clostridia bacterium]
MKGLDFRVRRLAALAVVAITAALNAASPFAATNALSSSDETLGGAAQRPALSLDLSRIFGGSGASQSHAGRVIMPGGAAVGVAMTTRGVLVVGLGEGPGMQAGIRAGDLLLSVNGVPLTGADTLTTAVNAAQGQPLTLLVNRDGRERTVQVKPRYDESARSWRLGLWVRDSTAGVGTLTYYDAANGTYGALGHAITDTDTGNVLPVNEGELMQAEIVDVKRGQRGTPGELRGSFLREQKTLGTVEKNTIYGIFGQMDGAYANPLYPSGLPVGDRSAVHTGAASILSTVSGTQVQEYSVEITQVQRQSSAAPKSLVLRVTDPRLLETTGGIVQGMSGSPILQDGKIIAAVTHVLVSDPSQGYGVFIDWMLEESDGII